MLIWGNIFALHSPPIYHAAVTNTNSKRWLANISVYCSAAATYCRLVQ